ncbi:hypothetical protein [Paraglaciecola aestuariivivens]
MKSKIVKLILVAGVACSAAPVSASFIGASVNGEGYLDYRFNSTSTATTKNGQLKQQSSAQGQSSASLQDSFGFHWAYEAYANISNSDALPELGALAWSNFEFVPEPGDSPIGLEGNHYYNTWVTTSAIQKYTFTGAESEEYTLDFNLHFNMLGGYRDTISTYITIGNSDYDPHFGGELGPIGEIGGDSAFFNGKDLDADEEVKEVNSPFSFTFTLNPNDVFYVDMSMRVQAGNQFGNGNTTKDIISGKIDALHTLSANFTSGNTNLLSASLAPATAVSEPSLIWLLGLVMFFIGLNRHKNQDADLIV